MKLRKRLAMLAMVCAVVMLAAVQGYGGHAASSGSSHWTYEGESGPEHWGTLSPQYATCSTGSNQSPINLHAAYEAKLDRVAFSYQGTPLNIINNGHTIQVNYQPGSTVTVDAQTYELLQFHFHTPSEHKVNGESFKMEMHLVHKKGEGELAVVGVLMKEGQANRFLDAIIQHIPKHAEERSMVEAVTINAADVLPESGEYFHYYGSLTTPPCSEGVNWSVLKTPVEASAAQIEAFHSVMGDNARPVQQVNQRFLLMSTQ